ncbi:hypothetical protein SK128_003286, partial [Halocaridina rubra]
MSPTSAPIRLVVELKPSKQSLTSSNVGTRDLILLARSKTLQRLRPPGILSYGDGTSPPVSYFAGSILRRLRERGGKRSENEAGDAKLKLRP